MSRGWIQVTPGSPCRQCKATHRCTYHSEGQQWKCCYDFAGANLYKRGVDDVVLAPPSLDDIFMGFYDQSDRAQVTAG